MNSICVLHLTRYKTIRLEMDACHKRNDVAVVRTFIWRGKFQVRFLHPPHLCSFFLWLVDCGRKWARPKKCWSGPKKISLPSRDNSKKNFPKKFHCLPGKIQNSFSKVPYNIFTIISTPNCDPKYEQTPSSGTIIFIAHGLHGPSFGALVGWLALVFVTPVRISNCASFFCSN